ncbi:hypothetical protein Q5P01_009048 [Channa striata]|uniref:Uncharacterized protein n=1 Tax=Channa striata TaxID=64152 RepID=A0AA88SX09_CHASR|nr:hypothetical protein Q5P01_009048 [Channa striata]
MATSPVIRDPAATSLLESSPASLFFHFFHFPKLCSSKEVLLRETGQQNCFNTGRNKIFLKSTRPPIMPEAAHLASMKPHSPTVTTEPSFRAAGTTLLTTTTLVPWEELHMQVHTILIVVIFCVVCFLLLLAFLYAFCFHCSIGPSPKDTGNECSLDREDATYKCSSSDNQSVANIV